MSDNEEMATNAAKEFREIVNNTLMARRELMDKMFDPRKNIDEEAGYPSVITTKEYRHLYEREGIGRRVVSFYPEECWADEPMIFETEDDEETEFEKTWKQAKDQLNLFHHLERVDELSGIGHFGILLFGLDDGKELSEPVDGIDEEGKIVGEGGRNHSIIYIRTFDEYFVDVQEYQRDVTNPRYGMPTKYSVQFEEEGGTKLKTRNVHWTRVIHVAENADVFAAPRMKDVFNRLMDLRKIYGGSGEMFWRGAFPGYSFEVNPEVSASAEFDKDAVRKEFDKFSNSLQRYLALTGVTAKSLAPQVSDPTNHVTQMLKAIAITKGIPWRIFVGSEEAKLASSQDTSAWNKRLKKRQNKYLTPMLIRPVVDRLIAYGVVPAPSEDGYSVEWPDMNVPSDKDKSEVARAFAEAMQRFVESGASEIMSPSQFLQHIMGMTKEEADAIIEEANELAGEGDVIPNDDDE